MNWFVKVEDGVVIGTPTRQLVCPDKFYPCNWGEYDPALHHIAGAAFDGQRVIYTICAWPYERTLDQAKTSKTAEIGCSFNASLAAGFTCSNGITMDALADHISLLRMGYDLAQRSGATSMYVVDYYNRKIDNVPISEVDAMILELGENFKTLHEKKNNLRMLVITAQTIEEVNAITW